MPPRKQYDEELVDDIGVGDIEVVLQCRDVDVAIELRKDY
jgi:hypothetical protein